MRLPRYARNGGLPRYARNDNVKTFMAFVLMSATYKNEN